MGAEEEIMMPTVQKMVKGGMNVKAILQDHLLACSWAEEQYEEFKTWITEGCKTLEKHQGEKPKVRVWVHALMAISSADQWKVFLPAVKAGLSDSVYNDLNNLIKMEAKLES